MTNKEDRAQRDRERMSSKQKRMKIQESQQQPQVSNRQQTGTLSKDSGVPSTSPTSQSYEPDLSKQQPKSLETETGQPPQVDAPHSTESQSNTPKDSTKPPSSEPETTGSSGVITSSPQSKPPAHLSPKPSPTDATTDIKGQPDTGDLIIEVANGPRLGSQIKVDIGRIGGQISDSGLRSVVSGYQRCVSPDFEGDGDAHFPRSLYRHAIFTANSSKDGFGNVLVFHMGAAIASYYNICRGEATAKDLQAIELLHRIASRGAASYKVFGSSSRGFRLEPMPEM